MYPPSRAELRFHQLFEFRDDFAGGGPLLVSEIGDRLVQEPGELGDGRGFEDPAQRELDRQQLLHRGHHLGRQDRVAPEVEEALVDADPLDAQGFARNAREEVLE